MKRILLALVIPWSLVGAPLPAVAQSSELMAAYRQYEALKAQGKYAEAEPFARNALELGEAEFGTDHTTYANLLNNLSRLGDDALAGLVRERQDATERWRKLDGGRYTCQIILI